MCMLTIPSSEAVLDNFFIKFTHIQILGGRNRPVPPNSFNLGPLPTPTHPQGSCLLPEMGPHKHEAHDELWSSFAWQVNKKPGFLWLLWSVQANDESKSTALASLSSICWGEAIQMGLVICLGVAVLGGSDDGWTLPLHKTAMQMETFIRKKKKTNRKTNVVAQKQQARLEGATAHLPLIIRDQLQTLWAQKRRQHFTHYGADKQQLGTDMLSPLVKILKNFHTSW